MGKFYHSWIVQGWKCQGPCSCWASKEGKGKIQAELLSGGRTSPGKKEKDMRKFKCFACHKSSHYANQCPNKKKGNEKTSTTTTTQMDELSEKFDKEFAFLLLCWHHIMWCVVCEQWSFLSYDGILIPLYHLC